MCRTLEEKLASSSYGVDQLATDFRSMCNAAVHQLFCARNLDLAQEASDILTLGNLQLRQLEKEIRPTATPTPAATAIEREDGSPDVDPADPFGDSFWDVSLPGWSDLLTLQARRVGFSKRQLEAAQYAAEGTRATVGVKRKIGFPVSEKGPPQVRPRVCRFPPEMQAVVAGLLDTVTAKTAEEAAKVCLQFP